MGLLKGRGIVPPKDENGLEETDFENTLKFITGVDAPGWNVSRVLTGTKKAGRNDCVDVKVTHVHLTFDGKPPDCPHCGGTMRYNDSKEREWRHANLDETVCFIHAEVPRFRCKCCDTTVQADTPWADENVSYTKRFMEVSVKFLAETSVTAVTRLLLCTWQILDSIIDRVLTVYLNGMDLSDVKRVRIDETSAKKRHKYITIVTDADTDRIIFITRGKDHHTIERFTEWLVAHNGDPNNIEIIASDFSEAFIKGARLFLPNAESVFDPFHAVQMGNKALDKDRSSRQVNGQRSRALRYALLKNPDGLKPGEQELINIVKENNEDLARSYAMNLALREGVTMKDPIAARRYLTGWCAWAKQEGSQNFKTLGQTIEKHLDGLVRAIETGINNGYQEGMNGMVQLTKSIARGYHNPMRLGRMVIFRDSIRYRGVQS